MNAQSSPMRKVELLSLWYRGGRTPRVREARNLLEVTQQLWKRSNAQPCHWPLPHTASPLSAVLFHGVPKLCVLMRRSDLSSPTLCEGSWEPTLGALMTYMSPTTIAPKQATQPKLPWVQGHPYSHSIHPTLIWQILTISSRFVIYTNKINRNQKTGLVQMMPEDWRWDNSCTAIRGMDYSEE